MTIILSSVNLKGGVGKTTIAVNFASYNKTQWAELIKEFDLGVQVKPTDSTRDLLGRLLNHLNENESVRGRLVEAAKKPMSHLN